MEIEIVDSPRLMVVAFVKASFDPKFYAYWIIAFADQHQLSWSDTVYTFKANPKKMMKLGLCKISDDSTDIEKVAKYVEVEALLNPNFQKLFFGFVKDRQVQR